MANSRAFAYNPTLVSVAGATNYGYLCVGYPSVTYASTGLTWWGGPSEGKGYVIAAALPGNTQPTPDTNRPFASVQFWGTEVLVGPTSTNAFLTLANSIGSTTFPTVTDATNWFTANGYWTSYSPFITTGLILNYDISNTSSYSGSGTTVTDLQGNSNGTLSGTPTYSSSNGGYLTFSSASNQSLLTNTSLNSKLSPANTSTIISFFTWVYPTGNGVIVTETSTTGWHDSQIEMVSGTVRFSVWSNGTGFASTISTPLNNWYYVGFTYDGTNLRGYVNGSLAVTSGTISRLTPYNNGGSAALRYGIALTDSTSLGGGGYGNFRFGAFHVYNTALSGSDVLSNYNSTKSRFGL